MGNKNYSGEQIKTIILTKNEEIILFSNSAPEITIDKIPKTGIELGLDLAGGSRALVKAKEKELSSSELSDLIDMTNNRINVYGISDVQIYPVTDLSGNKFMKVEVAGATLEDLMNLIEQQGKFEAKIGDEVVFVGGEKDIASVGRDAQHARISSCGGDVNSGYYCNFEFSVTLSAAAAQKHADVTDKLSVNTTSTGRHLNETLDLYLDDKFVSSLLISEGLKGRVTTQISISGSGTGNSQEEAYKSAESEMKNLQTILITGSLPYQLEIVKLDTISPLLGKNFTKSILWAGIAAFLVISLIIFIKYRKVKSSLALIFSSLSEIIIILGIAAIINWNLDLPSIAGIIATIGTGVDDMVIMMDESSSQISLNLKQKLKRAFVIILGAYFTSAVALLPLMWAGAGLLKGFAVTTIIGITTGVLITRPAFGDLLKNFQRNEQ
jgi:preprotein translocase subunit SecD